MQKNLHLMINAHPQEQIEKGERLRHQREDASILICPMTQLTKSNESSSDSRHRNPLKR